MEEIKNKISSLKKEQDSCEFELQDLYSKLGNKLFSDAVNPTEHDSFIENEILIKWQRLRDERDLNSNNILNIKNNSERLDELNKFEKDLNISKKDIIKKINKIKSNFILFIYKNFKPNCPNLFLNSKEIIFDLEVNLAKTNEKLSDLELDKENASFISKVGIASKIAVIKNKIKKLENNILNVLLKDIDNLQNNDEIKTLYNFTSFSDEMRKNYENLCELYTSLDGNEKSLESIFSEKETTMKNLGELDADANHNKKLKALTIKIHQLDTEIDELLHISAINFVNEFYDTEGKSLTGKKNFDDSLKVYSEFLNKIAKCRANKMQIAYQIQYYEVNQQIEIQDRLISNFDKVIDNSKKNIQELKDKIKLTESNKKNAKDELESLKVQSDLLKEKFNTENEAKN